MKALAQSAPELAVLGAGPAGIHAALAASRAGLGVTLIDAAPHAGGQVFRAPLDGSPASGADGREGDGLRRALAESGVAWLPLHRAWTVTTAPIGILLAGAGAVRRISPRALLVATGTTERVVPFPGWTLPGVIGLAAATILLKTPGPLPPGPIVVAGRGPLLAATAAGLLERGAELACVVDEATRAEWAHAGTRLLWQPALLARGLRWLRQLRRAGVPILHGHGVTRACGTNRVEAVGVSPLDHDGWPCPGADARRFSACLVAVGHGLVPATEVLQLFGAAMFHDPAGGAWLPALDADGRTSVAGVYAAGDSTGVRGAAAAALAGRLAGLAVAKDLGALSIQRHAALAIRTRWQLGPARRAGHAMAALMAPPAGRVAAMSPDTIVCRCEDVTRAEIDAAFQDGASDLNQLKTRTRCGMGPCQGRFCAPVVAALAAQHAHVAMPLRPWTARPPLCPMPIADLVGAFRYEDIPGIRPAI